MFPLEFGFETVLGLWDMSWFSECMIDGLGSRADLVIMRQDFPDKRY